MAGRAANNIWVAGWYGTLLHWNGTSWSDGASPIDANLGALWVGTAGDVWLAGNNSVILRRH